MLVVRGGARRGSAALVAVFVFVTGCHSARSAASSLSATASSVQPTTPHPTTSAPRASSPAIRPTTTTIITTITATAPSPVVGPTANLRIGVAPGASGIAATGTPGTWFVVDDAEHTSEVVQVTEAGLVRRMPIAGMSARNAEALAEGRCAASPAGCLFIGDIGDNASRRGDVVVYVATLVALKTFSGSPVAAAAWHYTYPDGPHDAEAMVVAPDGNLVIITKSAPDGTGHVPPHRIYRAKPGGGRLAFVTAFTPPNPVVPLQSLLTGTVVTDAFYDGKRLLLLTYDEVLDYTAPTANADPAGFPTWPHRAWPHPPLIQTEGIAGLSDGCGYIVASEEGPGGTQAALATISCG